MLVNVFIAAYLIVATAHAAQFTNCTWMGPCYQVCTDVASCLDVPDIASFPIASGTAAMFLTDNSGMKFEASVLSFSSTQPPPISHWQYIDLNVSVVFQEITAGFGGAFTDAAVINLHKLGPALQTAALSAYFSGAGGAKYSLGRVPIGASDFSTQSYSEDDVAGDVNLTHFNLSQFDVDRMSVIKTARAIAAPRDVKLFASPWSAPPWMKVNTSPNDGYMWGALSPDPALRHAWANYLATWLSRYNESGVPVWGITVENEPNPLPSFLRQTWDTMYYAPGDILDFVVGYLGPVMRSQHPDVKIMIHDDQKPSLMATVTTVLGNATARMYVDGIGIHWYMIPGQGCDNMVDVQNWLQANGLGHVFLLATEACTGFNALLSPPHAGPDLGNWERGQTYALDILNDLNAFAVGWTDWNLILDAAGGPNHAGNECDAPILLHPTNTNMFYKQPMYYHMSHFSAFIPVGSKRIGVVSGGPSPMEATAFLTPSGRVALVVLNRDYLSGREFTVYEPTHGYLSVNVPRASIITIVF